MTYRKTITIEINKAGILEDYTLLEDFLNDMNEIGTYDFKEHFKNGHIDSIITEGFNPVDNITIISDNEH